MYLFIDPGETTGWAKFNDEGQCDSLGQIKGFENLVWWLDDHINPTLNLVAYEEFVLYPWKSKAQMWSEFETVQVIGAIRAACIQNYIKAEKLHSRDYPMGFRYQGLPVPPHSNPLHDQLVAHAHGVFWLQTHGIRKPQAR